MTKLIEDFNYNLNLINERDKLINEQQAQI